MRHNGHKRSLGCLAAVLVLQTVSSTAYALQASGSVKSAQNLKALKLEQQGQRLQAILEADGVPQHKIYIMEEQKQLVLDVLNVRNPIKPLQPAKPHPLLIGVRTFELPVPGDADGATLARFIFDLKKPVDYKVDVEERRLRLSLVAKAPAPAGSAATTGAPAPAAGPAADTASSAIQPADVDPALFFGTPASDEYFLGPEDVIEVRVFEVDQLNRTLRVAADGNIDFPLIGVVPVNGLNTAQVAQRVAERLKRGFVKDPQVTILIKEFNSRKVSLLGAVAKPASYPLTGRRNLLQLLADAGGLGPSAGKVLYIFRQAPDGRSARLSVPLDELLVKGEARWNVWVRAGDVISVPAEQAVNVSVLGAVRSPGIHAIPVSDGATLTKAIARAGGLTERASQGGISIKRRDPSGKEVILKADLGDILSGKKPDVLLQEGDVVLVKESFF
jgi:polysaccharide export outer membrane protein